MSDEELIAIVEQADRTMTPGPWLRSRLQCGETIGSETMTKGVNRDRIAPGIVCAEHSTTADGRYGDQIVGDFDGIAALRNNAAAIAQELRRLADENAKLREMFDLATSIHTMTDEQLKQLIANLREAKKL